MGEPVLEIVDLVTEFRTDQGTVRAVDGVSFSIPARTTLGVVGESGSGKSVTAQRKATLGRCSYDGFDLC